MQYDKITFNKKGEKQMANARAQSIQMMMWTHHNLNVLHLYCRLRNMGFSKKMGGETGKSL